MLISLNWIQDFVELPAGWDPYDLAERFTRTTAEVESVKRVEIGAKGLVAARVRRVSDLPGKQTLRLVELETGGRRTLETVTAAPVIHADLSVVYAPPGASVSAFGEIGTAQAGGRTSAGLILPGEAIGIPLAAREAIFLGNEFNPGDPLPAELFDGWIIGIDNKSITHRPDLWGHYGIAREIAAIVKKPLKPYPVVPPEAMSSASLPTVGIGIADANACRRFNGMVFEGVADQPSPLWMQLRLGHVGMRPITGLVDLTNYIMAELGQPMHAFDGDKVGQIEVDWATDGERFRTLDGSERVLSADMLMVKCRGQSIGLAGVMGGLESEVAESTRAILLEVANFDPTVIRKTAAALGLRTDASARFEKSLDPANTALAIQRFVKLARPMYPNLKPASRFSDCFPNPRVPIEVSVNPKRVARTIGRYVSADEAAAILEPLGFGMTDGDTEWRVRVPSFRSTNDISIEADVIEEIARYVGYDTIDPVMPRVAMRRFEPNALHELEQRTLRYFTEVRGFHEIQGYIWYDSNWLSRLGYDPGPCVELANPTSEGSHRFRRTLMPGLLASVARNRFHFPSFSIIELGSVFESADEGDREFRHVGMIRAQRGRDVEKSLYRRLSGELDGWIRSSFGRPLSFLPIDAAHDSPWEHPAHAADLTIGSLMAGRISVVPMALRRAMDEHLIPWGIAWAELRLNGIEGIEPVIEPLADVPEHPLVEMDFSIVTPKTTRFAHVVENLRGFRHAILRQVRYVGCYEDDPLGPDQRSLTFRTVIGHDGRTLIDADVDAFRKAFESHVKGCGYEIR